MLKRKPTAFPKVAADLPAGKHHEGQLLPMQAFEITFEDKKVAFSIAEELKKKPLPKVEGVPLPQANDLDKVTDLLYLAQTTPTSKSIIAEYFNFDGRQADYYANAAAYLGLLLKNKKDRKWYITERGKKLAALTNTPERVREMAKAVLATRFSGDRMREFYKDGTLDLTGSKAKMDAEVIKDAKVNKTTVGRRTNSTERWLQWVWRVERDAEG